MFANPLCALNQLLLAKKEGQNRLSANDSWHLMLQDTTWSNRGAGSRSRNLATIYLFTRRSFEPVHLKSEAPLWCVRSQCRRTGGCDPTQGANFGLAPIAAGGDICRFAPITLHYSRASAELESSPSRFGFGWWNTVPNQMERDVTKIPALLRHFISAPASRPSSLRFRPASLGRGRRSAGLRRRRSTPGRSARSYGTCRCASCRDNGRR